MPTIRKVLPALKLLALILLAVFYFHGLAKLL
jgi:hypothetical protein